MKTEKIFENIPILDTIGTSSLEISSITCDSRECIKGSLFVAIPGFEADGHTFIGKAAENGAVAVAYQDIAYSGKIKELGLTGFLLQDTRSSLSPLADNFFRHPSREINLVGITGTNGKTTIATLLFRLFSRMGYGCGLLSTIANYIGDTVFPTTNTTQNPIAINSLLRKMVDMGCQYCFMEVSSHSLHQNRVSGLNFRGAVFTNITHDHLDYHKTFTEYIRCKKMLFDMLPQGAFAIINADDRNGTIMVQNTASDVYFYSATRKADFNVKMLEKNIDGSLLELDGRQVWTRFIGAHNAYNIAAVYGVARMLGADRDETLRLISSLESVSGRLEYINGGDDLTAVIDYAHTPDALENVLKTLKDISDGRTLMSVFGCGGNRDKTKRPEMAAIGAKYSDRLIITSDNPRFEKPEEIIEDMKSGLSPAEKSRTLFITDRKEAIRTALMTAPEGSIILIAGKGHEDYQIVNGVKSHFDDKEVVREYFAGINPQQMKQ